MIANWTALVLLPALVWPLLLAIGLVTPGIRGAALRCFPSAALPALAAAILPAAEPVPLSGFLLGSALELDGVGRVFLLLNAVLWLAGVVLATPHYRSITQPSHNRVLLLLAMAGTTGMALAADALLFLTFATITGYSLLGLLMCQGDSASRRAGGILVVQLVISDLLLFELLLHLAHEAASTDFAALRHAMAESHNTGLLLGLLILGLGIKTGVAGLHFWLLPAFIASAAMLRPVLVSFTLTAGILGVIRLLPLGDVQWISAGNLLYWLGVITVGYAVLASARGIGWSQVVTPYAAMAMNGVWLAVMGVALSYPQLWEELVAAAWPAMLQSGLALTAWMLIEAHGRTDGQPPWLVRWSSPLTWFAVALLATSALSLSGALRAEVELLSVLLTEASAFSFAFIQAVSHNGEVSRRSSDCVTTVPGGMAPGLTTLALLMASLLSAIVGLSRLSPANYLHAVWILPAALLLAWLSRKPLISALRVMHAEPPGGRIVEGFMKTFQSGSEIIGTRLAYWRDRLFDRIRIILSSSLLPGWLGKAEASMTRWGNAFALILVAMLVAISWSWDWLPGS